MHPAYLAILCSVGNVRVCCAVTDHVGPFGQALWFSDVRTMPVATQRRCSVDSKVQYSMNRVSKVRLRAGLERAVRLTTNSDVDDRVLLRSHCVVNIPYVCD